MFWGRAKCCTQVSHGWGWGQPGWAQRRAAGFDVDRPVGQDDWELVRKSDRQRDQDRDGASDGGGLMAVSSGFNRLFSLLHTRARAVIPRGA